MNTYIGGGKEVSMPLRFRKVYRFGIGPSENLSAQYLNILTRILCVYLLCVCVCGGETHRRESHHVVFQISLKCFWKAIQNQKEEPWENKERRAWFISWFMYPVLNALKQGFNSSVPSSSQPDSHTAVFFWMFSVWERLSSPAPDVMVSQKPAKKLQIKEWVVSISKFVLSSSGYFWIQLKQSFSAAML